MRMTYLLLSQALDGPPIGAPDVPMPTPNTPQSVDLLRPEVPESARPTIL